MNSPSMNNVQSFQKLLGNAKEFFNIFLKTEVQSISLSTILFYRCTVQ